MLTTEQLEIRRTGIGGSEIASVLGVNPWCTPVQLAKRKRGEEPPQEMTVAMMKGHAMEPVMEAWLQQQIPHAVISEIGTMRHPAELLALATPDRVLECTEADIQKLLGVEVVDAFDLPKKEKFIVEMKTVGNFTAKQWGIPGTDEIPEYYLPQVIWQCGVTGIHKAIVIAMIGDEPRVYRVDFDQELFDFMLERAKVFWVELVASDHPNYEPWMGVNYQEAVRVYSSKKKDDSFRDATPEEDSWIDMYDQMTANESEIRKKKEELKAKICIAIKDGTGLIGTTKEAVWTQIKKDDISYEKIFHDLNKKIFESGNIDLLNETQNLIKKHTETKTTMRFSLRKIGG